MSKYNSQLEVGDLVKIIDDGWNFSAYPQWFDTYAPDLKHYYEGGSFLANQNICEIVAIGQHCHPRKDDSRLLYAVIVKDRFERRIALIQKDGVKEYV